MATQLRPRRLDEHRQRCSHGKSEVPAGPEFSRGRVVLRSKSSVALSVSSRARRLPRRWRRPPASPTRPRRPAPWAQRGEREDPCPAVVVARAAWRRRTGAPGPGRRPGRPRGRWDSRGACGRGEGGLLSVAAADEPLERYDKTPKTPHGKARPVDATGINIPTRPSRRERGGGATRERACAKVVPVMDAPAPCPVYKSVRVHTSHTRNRNTLRSHLYKKSHA